MRAFCCFKPATTTTRTTRRTSVARNAADYSPSARSAQHAAIIATDAARMTTIRRTPPSRPPPPSTRACRRSCNGSRARRRAPPFVLGAVAFVFAYFASVVAARSIRTDDVLVHTNLGLIRGFEQHTDGVRVRTFFGIPFAKAPIGTRRFARPEPIGRWDGELSARHLTRTCSYVPDTAFPHFIGVVCAHYA